MNIHKLFEITDKYFNKSEVNHILELGSRDGLEAMSLSEYYSNAKIISFECNPATYYLVEQNIANNKNISAYQIAISDTEGMIDFYQSVHGNPGSSSIFKKSGKYDYIENMRQNRIQVPSTTLKTFLDKNDINNVDIIWADLQGAELKAFDGMGDHINNVKVILTEVEYKEMYDSQPLYEDIKQFLESKGFIEEYKTSVHDNFWGDAIFVNSKAM
jgi:FkbM family methyltransferase